jgi:type II secretory pathway component PulK
MNSKSGKKGLVLVAVLWLMVMLMAIVATVGRNSRLDTKVSLSTIEESRCKWACRAGIEKAMGILYEDPRESDSLADFWSDNGEDFNDIILERCKFTVKVIDEAGKLNINIATKEQLMALPNMTEDIADAIIDWRDADDTPSATGAEAGYYENLQYKYMARNGPFRTLRELLLVKGVTEELFFGEDTNFNGKLDYNERDGDASPPHDDEDDEIDPGWIAYLTCYSYDNNVDATGASRININQANESQLETSLGITRDQASSIVQNRPNNGYQSITDLLSGGSSQSQTGSGSGSSQNQTGSGSSSSQNQGIDTQTFSQIADKITVSSGQQVQGKININTASEYVLTALLGGGDAAESTAQSIIAYRESLTYGMESIGELLQSGTISSSSFSNIVNNITTRSNVYTIRCVATADRSGANGFSLQTEAVVDRSSSPYEILYWYQGAGN